jgi:hypothetical protein
MTRPFVFVRTLVAVIASALFLGGCQAEKFGDHCDGFFANGCKGPLTCMTDGKGKFCSKTCSINKAFPELSDKCPSGSECVEAKYEKGSMSASMGSMCARPM